jgi:solute carrier family 39 (zinc transporter), member 1/2/3
VILVFYKACAALLVFFISLATVIYPLKNKSVFKHTEPLSLGEAIASGIFLGAAFFHMLPDAIETFGKVYGNSAYPLPEAVCMLGFLLLLFLERLSLTHSSSKNTVPYILALILIIHAVVEGIALGIGSTLSETIMILIAILAHKGSESFALCVALLRHQLPFKRIILIIGLFALMTPLGISIGTAVNQLTFAHHGEPVAALFNAFAAGTFLYISTLHHIHFHKHAEEKRGLLEFACLALGVASMGVIALWA